MMIIAMNIFTAEKCTLFLAFMAMLAVTHAAEKNATSVCKDKLPTNYCKLLKNNGACFAKLIQMMNYCPETCEFCDNHCTDFLPRLCPWWQGHYACITHPSFMQKYCKKSCGKCSSSAPGKPPACSFTEFGCCWDKTPRKKNGKCPECRNRYVFCDTFRIDCFSGKNRKLMFERCPETCKLCRRGARVHSL